MINFTDIIKNHFLEEFAEASVGSVVAAMLIACFMSLFIIVVYKLTFRGVLYQPSFSVSLVLLSMITTLAILTVTSNVVLSLGMVGALSIVRFRTAVKDPMDTIFMFWAIVVGITSGAGLYGITLIGSLIIGVVFLVINLLNGKLPGGCYLLIIRCRSEAAKEIQAVSDRLPKCRLKSMTERKGEQELIFELRTFSDVRKEIEPLKRIEGVTEVSLTSYGSGTLL